MRQNGESLDLAVKELSLNPAQPLTSPVTLSKLLNISGLQFSDRSATQDKNKLFRGGKIAFLNISSLKCPWSIQVGMTRGRGMWRSGKGEESGLEIESWETLACR